MQNNKYQDMYHVHPRNWDSIAHIRQKYSLNPLIDGEHKQVE